MSIAGDSTPFHSTLRRPLIRRRCRGRIHDHDRAHGCGCGAVRGIAVHCRSQLLARCCCCVLTRVDGIETVAAAVSVSVSVSEPVVVEEQRHIG